MLDERVNPRIGELPPQEIKFGKNVKIVMDEYVNRQKYYSYLDEYEREISHPNIDIFTPNAESKYTAVALASMIARMYFLYDIKGMSKAAGFKIPLGSASTKIMNAAKKIDPKDRHKYIKLHFKNTNVLN
ncbi:MAG: hypothetical protein K2M43_03605 [Mycoplasmoidaceae bacterium]|nr:hypothetical protein [Mycoplasmoidaceae bacterium]